MPFPTANILAYFRTDESSGNAVDATGNGFTLTNNNVTLYGAGKINNGAQSIGATGHYLSRNDILGRTAGNNGNFTMTAWVNFTTIGTSAKLFSAQDGTTSPWIDWDIRASSGKFRFNRGKMCVANEFNDITTTINTGTFYFIGLTWDGTTLTPYIDGAAQTTSTPSGTGGDCGGASTAVGNDVGDVTVFTIDEIAFWNAKLSSTQMSDLYNGGAGLSFPSASPTTNPAFLLNFM